MEFWPRKKTEKRQEKRIELQSIFDPQGFAPHERDAYRSTFEEVREPEDFLNIVDFKTLNEIFDDIEKRAGGPAELSNTGHKVERNKVTFRFPSKEATDENNSRHGSARVATGEIFLLWEEGDIPATVRALQLLHVLSHEAAHVRGGYETRRWDKGKFGDKDWSAGFDTRIGLQEVRSSISDSELCEGTGLNEAVTEKISLEVLTEYLRRTGHSGHPGSTEMSRLIDRGYYAEERVVLEYILEKLALAAEVDVETVWRGMVRAYMSGSHQLQDLMGEVMHVTQNSEKIRDLVVALRYNFIHEYSLAEVLDAAKEMGSSSAPSSRLEVLMQEFEESLLKGKFFDRALSILELDGPKNDLKLR